MLLPLSALDAGSPFARHCSKTPRPRFFKEIQVIFAHSRVVVFTRHLYSTFVCFFDVLYVNVPWVSALQFLVRLLDLRQELLDTRQHYRQEVMERQASRYSKSETYIQLVVLRQMFCGPKVE